MPTRRKFAAIAAAGITGVGIMNNTLGDGSEARALFEIINNAEIAAEVELALTRTGGGDSIKRRSRLSPGERTHYHISIHAGKTYEITGEAFVKSEDADIEGFNTSSEFSGTSFHTLPTSKRAVLQNGTRVVVKLTSNHDIEVALPKGE